MFSLTLILLVLVVAVTFEYEFKCPESGEWRLRAIGFNCSIISQYVCIFRYPEREYHETCDGLDYSNIGSKLIYEPFFNKAYCSYERYQPFPFSTDGSSKCVYQKSFCTEKGQYLFQRGSQRSDITCGCDLTRGYEFTNKPSHDCYCVPSKDDCSCHKLPCNYLVDQCPQDRDEMLTRSLVTTVKDNRFNDAVNIFNDKNNGKKYRFQCLYITSLLLVVMIIAVTIVFALLKLQDDLNGYIIEQPPITIKVLEGKPAELKYKLSNKRFPVMFLKNNMFIPESTRITKSVFGSSKILNFTNVTLEDEGSYCIMMAETKSNSTELIVNPMFSSKIEPRICIEGNTLELECDVCAYDIEVLWYKENQQLHACDNIGIKKNITKRTLTIKNSALEDSGKYYVKAGKAEREIQVTVKGMFRRPLVDVTIMEGLDAKFEFETEEENVPVQWFYNSKKIIESTERKQIPRLQGRMHTLTILQTRLEDSGKYSIRTKAYDKIVELNVKEMPETIKNMSVYDREAFLKAANSGTTTRYNIRVMIVGKQSAGKTCLLRRLMNEDIDGVISTDGINIERRKCHIDIKTGEWHFSSSDKKLQDFSTDQREEFADCGFWDFAGQKELYATHQTFLSSNAVYLLVVDISEDFKSKTYENMIEKEFDTIGEYIDFWLDNIHCYCTDEKKTPTQGNNNDRVLNPPVIIVGTGIDKVPSDEMEDRKQKFLTHLSHTMSTQPKRRHFRKPHFLSNKFPSDNKQEFKRLRKDIFSKAKDLSNWEENLPVRWVVFEKEIFSKKVEKAILHAEDKEQTPACENKKVMLYTEAQCLADECSFPNVKQETSELDSFLKYEHEIGNIVFFKDVKEYIVLDTEWLVDVFRCFVSHDYNDETLGMTEWEVLSKTGKLEDTLIETLLRKVPGLNLKKHKDYLLDLMEAFGIIVKPKNYASKNDIYMPCMIKPMPFQEIFGKVDVETKYCKKSSWLCLVFNFLPPSYFNHVLVSFVKNNQLFYDTKDSKLGIYRNVGIFQLNNSGSEILVICLSKNLIAMKVLQFNSSEDVCYSNIKTKLTDLVDSIKLRYRINVTYEIRFKCNGGSLIYNKGISYDEAMERSEYLCTDHKEMHSSKEIYRFWLKEEEVEDELNKKGRRKCNNCENMSVYNCYNCNTVLCEDCSRKHDYENKNRRHFTQLISDGFKLNCTFIVTQPFNCLESIIGIKYLPNGEDIVSLETNKEVKTFSVIGIQRLVIQLKYDPLKITVVDKNTVAVLFNNHSMALVDVQQNHVQYICINGTPFSAGTFTYIENEFYISDQHCIMVIEMSGSVNRRITLSFTPYDMCYDVDSQRIYCIVSKDSELICIDRDGNTIFTFTDPNMTSLKGLTIDNEGNVLVLCSKGHLGCVIKVDSNGDKSEVVITNIYPSIIGNPRICYDHLTNSVVIGTHETVSIYKRK